MSVILIFGANGNIAGLTTATLAKEHSQLSLRVTSSRESGCASLRSRFPEAEVVMADWYDPASLRAVMKGVDKVFVVTPDFVTDETVVTPNIIQAVRNAGGVSQILRMIAIPPRPDGRRPCAGNSRDPLRRLSAHHRQAAPGRQRFAGDVPERGVLDYVQFPLVLRRGNQG